MKGRFRYAYRGPYRAAWSYSRTLYAAGAAARGIAQVAAARGTDLTTLVRDRDTGREWVITAESDLVDLFADAN